MKQSQKSKAAASVSEYVTKGFAKPTKGAAMVFMENEILNISNGVTKVNIFVKYRNADVDNVIRTLRQAGLPSEAFPDLNVFVFDDKVYTDCSVAITRLYDLTCRKALPIIFINGNCVGGIADVDRLHKKGVLAEMFKKHDYDLVVIGGGSGGLAAAKKAAEFEKKVAVLDFVKPTPVGTTWGLGGTCVNVGCIPKKLMHHAALLGHSIEDSKNFGWHIGENGTNTTNDWKTLVENVHNHILGLNWNYKTTLREKKVTYINGYGSFVGSHKISAVQKDGKVVELTADKFVVAVGLRPRYLDCPGAREYCITSDDLFTLPYAPGKTLLVGASYVSLECAGFLHGVGFDVTVMVRSILLRGFDQDMAERIRKQMEDSGIKFINKTIPTKIEKIEDGKPGLLRVTAKADDGQIIVGEYNTVILAIGRDAMTDDVGLQVVGVDRNEKNKKIVSFPNDQSVSMPHVYAIGDVSDGKPELTPVAIQAGRFLMTRLFEGSFKMCDYLNVPTTVFTPLEYGCCGYAEEDAKEKYPDSVEVFHSEFIPLEYTVAKRGDSKHCYAKVIFQGDLKNENKMRVIGLHILGPNAGEITQGFAIALKTRATREDFVDLIGIHPTCAEVLTFASLVPKTVDPAAAGGC